MGNVFIIDLNSNLGHNQPNLYDLEKTPERTIMTCCVCGYTRLLIDCCGLASLITCLGVKGQ